ncbi:MAG TPA: methionine/alanine import family NSS transporter small subunit [Jiangellaceae bacterium]
MSGEAVIMMIVAIIVVWGGLVAGVVALHRHPDEPEDAD